MDQESIMSAMKQICAEKGLSIESVLETIETALAAAYRKDFGNKLQNIKIKFNVETGESKATDEKTVVEDMPPEEEDDDIETGNLVPSDVEGLKLETKGDVDNKTTNKASASVKAIADKETEGKVEEGEEEKRRFNPKTEIQISVAKEIKKNAKIGEVIITKLEIPAAYGRMAAQTAKQVIIQKLREAERTKLVEEFQNKIGMIIAGVVQRRESNRVLLDLGKATAVLPREEQIRTERHQSGDHIKVFVKSVSESAKGPEIIVSRSNPDMVREMFTLEIPEISAGTVEIKSIAREAGFRSKVAVVATEENIDPIGSCVGQRGARIQTIIGELGGEKIDIIEYDEDPGVFIANALSPAKVTSIEVNEKEQTAVATVKEDQFSLAIGKEGQNVRLAAKLTGWKINIMGEDGTVAGTADDDVKKDNEKKEDESDDEKETGNEDTKTQKQENKKTDEKSSDGKEAGEEKKEKKEKKKVTKKDDENKKDEKKEEEK